MEEVLEIRTSGAVDADVTLPGSKSYTNRALLIASLAEGNSLLEGALFSEDTNHMANCLGQLGLEVEADPEKRRFRVVGSAGKIPEREAQLFVGNAGTAMRFLTAACCLGKGRYEIDGASRMRQRPIGELVQALRQLGAKISYKQAQGYPPLIIEGGGLRGGKVCMSGTISSQFLSALLMVAPCAADDVVVEVEGDLVSKPFIDMTLQIMKTFGVDAQNDDYCRFTVSAGQRYKSLNYYVEPDATAASYFLAAAAITGGRVRIKGLGRASAQGDVGFLDLLEGMGCEVSSGADWLELKGNPLRGIEADLSQMPDVAQTLAVVALFAEGSTRITGIGNLRIKETDRVRALAVELSRLGGKVEEQRDALTITPGELKGTEVETYDDHRMAMSLALVGLRVAGVGIRNPGCVSKTFPDYFQRLDELIRSSKPGATSNN